MNQPIKDTKDEFCILLCPSSKPCGSGSYSTVGRKQIYDPLYERYQKEYIIRQKEVRRRSSKLNESTEVLNRSLVAADSLYEDYQNERIQRQKEGRRRSSLLKSDSAEIYIRQKEIRRSSAPAIDPLYQRYQKERIQRKNEDRRSSSLLSDSTEGSNYFQPAVEPLYERHQKEHIKGKKEIRRQSSTLSDSKEASGRRKPLSLFGKKAKKVLSTSKQEIPEPPDEFFQKIIEDPSKLVSGVYPPDIEVQVLTRMKDAACAKAKKKLWEESYFILISVLRCERVSLGESHPQLANTLYHLGVTLNFLGDTNGALSALEEGIQILFPKRYDNKNVDLAALFYQCGLIKGKNKDFSAALYYLDIAKQVEIHIFGHTKEKTKKMIADYEYAKNASRRLNEIRSRTA